MATHSPGDDPTLEFPVPPPTWVGDPPPYPPPSGYPPQPVVAPPRPRGRGCLTAIAVAVGVVLVLVLAAVALLAGAADEADDQAAREAADVELIDCSTSGLGHMTADVRITNRSSKRSNYVVDVAFESPDGTRQLATEPVFVNDLGSGQVSEQTANSLTGSSGDFECDISQVQRFSDEG